MKVALISSNKWKNMCRGDLSLLKNLLQNDIEAEIVSWQEELEWANYDLLILRSPWDYYESYEDFCNWLISLKKHNLHMANGIDNILLNINKKEQFNYLQSCEIPLVPYICTDSYNELIDWYNINNYRKAVIKPVVSAGGYQTFLIQNRDELLQKMMLITNTKNQIILQPYVEDIVKGELSLVYFHGKFSHAVLRYPGVIEKYEKSHILDKVEKEWLLAAEKICECLHAEDLLYVRIDLVRFHNEISIMEVELSEPDLYLGFESESARMKRFIKEIEEELHLANEGDFL